MLLENIQKIFSSLKKQTGETAQLHTNRFYPLKVIIPVVIFCGILATIFIHITPHSQRVHLLVSAAQTSTTVTPGSVPGCQFQKADAPLNVAFCDTFDQPAGTGNRSGDLNGLVWGVSRIISGGGDNYNTGANPSQGQNDNWAPVALQKCGSTSSVLPDSDVAICNGQVVEAVNDDGGQTDLAMYPKQPFDISGRTGTVVFDVSANSQGPHAAWPSFVYTDQPVPAPYSEASGIATSARNSFGFTLAATCGAGSFCGTDCSSSDTTVDTMFVTRNYGLSNIDFKQLGCVQQPTSPTQLNHFEIRISQSQVQVWATNPGSTTLKEIAEADNANLPLTRGLVWMEDIHYNADKFNSQQSHTFGWDNLGFDGPILPRDLAFDAADNNKMDGGAKQLGWAAPSDGSTQAITVPGLSNIDKAAGAIVTFNWDAMQSDTPSIRVNGGAWHTTVWPGGNGWSWKTIAVPVDLTELHTGDNTVEFKTADTTNGAGVSIANIDIILVGAGGVPNGGTITSQAQPTNPSTVMTTTTPTVTVTPTITPTRSPVTSSLITTLPPGAQLPTDAQCAAQVVHNSWEPRSDNTTANHTNVYAGGYRMPVADVDGYGARVTGNFTGTTDEILQWAACKWGFDVNTVRAQAVVESFWHQSTEGDCIGNSQPSTNGCQSVGILQVRGADLPPTHPDTWPYALTSTAFNADYTLAVRRDCYDGKMTWLNTVDHTGTYAAGDEYGCMGVWFSGRWHTTAANTYIQKVKTEYANQQWIAWGFPGNTSPTNPITTPTPTTKPTITTKPTPTISTTNTGSLQISTTGLVSPLTVTRGHAVTFNAIIHAKNKGLANGVVDMEVYSMAPGFPKLCQPITNNVSIPANTSKTISASCTVNNTMPLGSYVLRIGVFGNNWSPLYFWTSKAATFTVKR